MKIILSDINATTKNLVLAEISSIASINTGISEDKLLLGFKERENLTSTGMVEGIAIPHTMQPVSDPCLLICKSNQITDWETLDGSCVELEIAIIAPEGGDEHLKILSQVSRKLINAENIANLKAAQTVDDVKDILGL